MPSTERPPSSPKGVTGDTIIIEISMENHKRLSNLEELDEIYEAFKVMMLKAKDRNKAAFQVQAGHAF